MDRVHAQPPAPQLADALGDAQAQAMTRLGRVRRGQIRPAGPDEPPVTVDETIVRGETPEERAANVQKLIALGVIAPAHEPTTTTTRNEKPAKEA